MITLDYRTVIADSLETHFGLKTYLSIIRAVKADGFAADEKFRKAFNGYFRVRQRSAAWYDGYYGLMVRQKQDPKTFGELLEIMERVDGRVEASFVSKLIAAVDPERPIWDRYVLENAGCEAAWKRLQGKPAEERIAGACKIYRRIEEGYRQFLSTKQGRACVAEFDKALPEYKLLLTGVKKLDYLLWSRRS